jgi:hypothetical protein
MILKKRMMTMTSRVVLPSVRVGPGGGPFFGELWCSAVMAQSRCNFSIFMRYGSLKVCSINAFLSVGLIGAEELSFRGWNCFEHLESASARRREPRDYGLPHVGLGGRVRARHARTHARPPSAALGRRRRHSATDGRPSAAGGGRHRRRSARAAWLRRLGPWAGPPGGASTATRRRSGRPRLGSALAPWLRLPGPRAGLSVLWDSRTACPASRRGLRATTCPSRAVAIGSGLVDSIAGDSILLSRQVCRWARAGVLLGRWPPIKCLYVLYTFI